MGFLRVFVIVFVALSGRHLPAPLRQAGLCWACACGQDLHAAGAVRLAAQAGNGTWNAFSSCKAGCWIGFLVRLFRSGFRSTGFRGSELLRARVPEEFWWLHPELICGKPLL